MNVEKQIEKIIGRVKSIAKDIDPLGPDIAAFDDIECWIRALLSSAQSGEQAVPQAVQAAVPSDAEIDAAIQAFDWEGWVDPKKAKRAFTREALARWTAPAHPAEGVQVSVSDENIDAAVYAQCPDFDAAHEGPSIDDVRAIVRAVLVATQPAAQRMDAPLVNMTPPATSRDRWMYEQGRLAEREIICAAIKAEDDHCVDQGDYMLDSDDCIKIVRGEWMRPDFTTGAAQDKQGGAA